MFKKIWFSPKLPPIHYNDPVGWPKKWIFNPVKRWAAKYYLLFLQMFTGIKVIGITGSAGKTTTKEILASILSKKGKTIFSKANIDPVYNIPNTILRTPFSTKFLILEMGVEFPFEMDFYLWLSKPDVGVITNIFPTHLEFFGDVDGVLKEKSKIVTNLEKEDYAVLNSGDYHLKKLGQKLTCRVKWYKTDRDPIKQNVNAAIAISEILGLTKKEIASGLSDYKMPLHRLTWVTLKSGTKILDDSYNSNPEAVKTAIDVFLTKAGKGKKVAVLGDMLELGEYSEFAHKEVGRKIAEKHFDVLITVGTDSELTVKEAKKFSKKIKTYSLKNTDAVIDLIKPMLTRDTSILIKGSHGIGLYKLVESLT